METDKSIGPSATNAVTHQSAGFCARVASGHTRQPRCPRSVTNSRRFIRPQVPEDYRFSALTASACCIAMRPHRRRGAIDAVIQVGPLFAEHLHTLPDVLVAGMDPIHFGDWKLAAQGQSQVISPPVSSLPRHAQQAHSLLHRYEVRRGYPAALAMPSLPMTLLHHSGQQRNERAQCLLA